MSKVLSFCSLSYSGLGDVSKKELRNLGASNIKQSMLHNYDMLSFEMPYDEVSGLGSLMSVEDVFCMLGDDVNVHKRKDLIKISPMINRNDIIEAINLKNIAFRDNRKSKMVRFYCFVKQNQESFVYRRDISNKVIDRIVELFPKWNIVDPANLEIWGFHLNDNLRLGLRLSDKTFKYRYDNPPKREGALRPTIAGAMVYSLNPNQGQVIVDPMCGTGTILKEVGLASPQSELFGGDIDKDAISISRKRLHGFNADITEWDATELPFEDSHADAIISNLPFGKKFSTKVSNRSFYHELISHWVTKLKPNGKMLLLTADDKSLVQTMKKNNLSWRIIFKVKILGTWARAYLVTKPTY